MKTSVATPQTTYQKMSTFKKTPPPLHISDVKKKSMKNKDHFITILDSLEMRSKETATKRIYFLTSCLVSPHVQFSLNIENTRQKHPH